MNGVCVLCGDLGGCIPASFPVDAGMDSSTPPTSLPQTRFEEDAACASLLIAASPLQRKQAAPSICLGGCLVLLRQENANSAGWISKNVARFGASQQAVIPVELWLQEFQRKEPFWGIVTIKGFRSHIHYPRESEQRNRFFYLHYFPSAV